MLAAKAFDSKVAIIGASLLWTAGLWLVYTLICIVLAWRPERPVGFLISLGLALIYPILFHYRILRRTGLHYRAGYAYFALVPIYTADLLIQRLDGLLFIVVGSLVITLAFVMFDQVLEHSLKIEQTTQVAIWQRLDLLSFPDYLQLRIPGLKQSG